jgi:hypothetical protein
LPWNFAEPDGLPPGVSFPPGTVRRPGEDPERRTPIKDPFHKVITWHTEATVTGSNLDALHQYFVDACAKIGWVYNPLGTTKLNPAPADRKPWLGEELPAPYTMLIASCSQPSGEYLRTPTPWTLAWGITDRGSGPLDLDVEVRDTNP